MTGAAYAAVLTFASALATVVGLELHGLMAADAIVPEALPPPQATTAGAGRPADDASGAAAQRTRWAEAVQARPVFAPDRRPASRPVIADAGPPGMPRLAGIVVHGTERSAILVPAGNGRPVVAREGTHVGGILVQAIRADQVTVANLEGTWTLRPSRDPRLPPPPPLPPPPLPIPLPPAPQPPSVMQLLTTGPAMPAGYAPGPVQSFQEAPVFAR